MSSQTSWLPAVSAIDVTLVLVTLAALLLGYVLYAMFAGKESWEKYGVKQGTMGFNFVQSVDRLLAEGVDSVGVHLGLPMFITRDLGLLRQIMVKEFNNFSDRTNFIRTRTPLARGLFFLTGSRWKTVRHLMSPSFSTSKMKQMSSYIHSSARKLALVFEACAKEDRLIEVKHTLGQYTSGIIAKTGFGLATDCLGEHDNEFTRHCKNLVKVRGGGFYRLLQMIFFRLPRLNSFLIKTVKVNYLDNVDIDSWEYFNHILSLSIQERKEIEKMHKKKPGDFLQSLVSAHAAADGGKTSKRLTEADVIAQSLLILFAAFDTTSTTLQFCLLLLAMHPDIQEKVYQEIVEVVTPQDGNSEEEEDADNTSLGPTPSHDQLQHLHYTQQVIDEALRMYPPAGFVSRLTNQTTTLSLNSDAADTSQPGSETLSPLHDTTADGFIMRHDTDASNNDTDSDAVRRRRGQDSSAEKDTSKGTCAAKTITLPAGAAVLIPIAKIHMDPRHYPDPEKFDPDRFLPENKAARDPFAFIPFGLGPRQCIGMRLAYLEIKTALVYVLRRVRLEVNDQTEPQTGGKVSLTLSSVLVVNKPIKLAVRLR